VSVHPDVAEATGLQYKTTALDRLLKGSRLDLSDEFALYCLAQALPTAMAYNAIMVDHCGDCAGIEYKQPDREKYAFVLPDASRPGKWRVSFFDKSGFSYHEVADTSAAAAEEMVRLGFTQKAAGCLDKLAETREWALGTDMADLLFRLNAKQLSWAEYASQSQALNNRFIAETASPADLKVLEYEEVPA
jgi:hypothetical protein